MNTKEIFTPEYYKIIEKIKEEKTEKFRTSFKEEDITSLYKGMGIEIVQEDLCQLSCEWCYINQCKNYDFNEPLSFEKFKKIIDKVYDYNRKYGVKLLSFIAFMGGEPTLNPYLDIMIEYSLKNNLMPMIVTNGIKFADIGYAEKICKEGVGITVHLPLFGKDGDKVLDEAVKNSGYSMKLKQAIDNLLKLKKERRNIKLIGELVVCRTTKDYAADSYIYCRENGIEPFMEFIRISNDSDTNSHLLLNDSDIYALFEKLYKYDVENHYAEDCLRNKLRYLLPPAVNTPCTYVQDSFYVKFEKEGFGKVTSCCGQSISHGNIMEDSIEDILKHKKDTKIFTEQSSYIKGPCSVCELYDLTGCEGGCRGNAKNTFLCEEASDPQCIFIRPEIRKDKRIMTMERQYF